MDEKKEAEGLELMEAGQISQSSAPPRRKKFTTAEKIIASKYSDDPVKAAVELERYRQAFTAIDATIENDINGPDAFNIKLQIPELITEAQLTEFFHEVLDSYSDFSKKAIEGDYAKNPKEWFESTANRARLVLIEATDTNIQETAKALLEASPLERVVVVGLDADKQQELQTALVAQWEEKIAAHTDPESYRQKVLMAMSPDPEHPITSIDDASLTLETLMGPHGFSTANDISFENLSSELEGTFASKIDEVVLYGASDHLAQQLPRLAEQSGVDLYMAIKSNEFETEGNALFWTASLEGIDQPLQHLTTSKNPGDILAPGQFQLNPDLDRLFERKAQEHGLDAKSTAFLKDMLTKKSLYLNNLSPKLYATTITKAQSGINGKGAIVVGDALPRAVYGSIVATAYGARFAINSTMIDTANDKHQEDQEHMLAYRTLFNALTAAQVTGDTPAAEAHEAFEHSLDRLFNAYNQIENDRQVVTETQQGDMQRLYSLEHANKTNNKNERGISLVRPQPLNFAYGVAATTVGLAFAATATSASIAFPIVGASVFAGFTTLLATSLKFQQVANSRHLSRWHRASARARQSYKSAQDKRDKLVKEYVAKEKTSLRQRGQLVHSQAQERTQEHDIEMGGPSTSGRGTAPLEVKTQRRREGLHDSESDKSSEELDVTAQAKSTSVDSAGSSGFQLGQMTQPQTPEGSKSVTKLPKPEVKTTPSSKRRPAMKT
ncbi:MAG: hypothetical protein AAGB24_09810 [Bacteroidota bacterium]